MLLSLNLPIMSSRRAGCCRIGKKPGIVILDGAKRIEGILFETRYNSRIVKLLRAVPARFFSRPGGIRMTFQMILRILEQPA